MLTIWKHIILIWIQANLRFQSEKIMEYGKQFLDENTTFYLMFEQRHPEITDK